MIAYELGKLDWPSLGMKLTIVKTASQSKPMPQFSFLEVQILAVSQFKKHPNHNEATKQRVCCLFHVITRHMPYIKLDFLRARNNEFFW